MSLRHDSPPKILLIDDNAGDVRLIRGALKVAVPGVEVRSVSGRSQAIPRLKEIMAAADSPNLVLLDLQMPRRSGLEILADIRKEPTTASLPVVILTSAQAPQDIFRAYTLYANDVVTKPLNLHQPRSAIQTLRDSWPKVANLPEMAYVGDTTDQDPSD